MKTVGILGPKGTHSEEAALWLKKFLREDWRLEICADIFDALNAVKVTCPELMNLKFD